MPKNIFIREFSANNFKSFTELRLTDFDRVNLITGKNNTGKTSLLEAIFMSLGPTNPVLWATILARRGVERINVKSPTVPYLFHKLNTTKPITFSVKTSKDFQYKFQFDFGETATFRIPKSKTSQQGKESQQSILLSDIAESRTVRVTYTPYNGARRISYATITPNNVDVRAQFKLPFAESISIAAEGAEGRERQNPTRYSQLDKLGRLSEFEQHLKAIEPKLIRTSLAVENEETYIMADTGYGLMPLSFLGSGMNRLATILLSIASYPDAVVLIDEVENGFHHTALKTVWNAIAEFAKEFRCQIIASTHSDECIAAAHNVFKERSKYELRLYRMIRKEERTEVFGFDRAQIESSLVSGWELR